MKKGKVLFCGISAILLLCGFTWGISSNILIFKGKDNTEIKVSVSNPNDYQNNNTNVDNEKIEIGQIIVNDGVKEVVFAVGEDGGYITQPFEE